MPRGRAPRTPRASHSRLLAVYESIAAWVRMQTLIPARVLPSWAGFLTINMLIFLGLFFPSLRGVHVFLGSIVVFILTVSFEAKRQSFGEDGPPLPPPFGAGLAEDKYLWLLPPFWTVVLGPTATFLAWAGMRYTGLEARFQCWWKTSFDAMSSSELAQFGEISLSEDEHGTIIQNIMQHVQEPVTTKKAWPFIFAIPLICTLAIPWDYDERMQLAGQGLQHVHPLGAPTNLRHHRVSLLENGARGARTCRRRGNRPHAGFSGATIQRQDAHAQCQRPVPPRIGAHTRSH
jgi:hypothetical protein